MNDPGVIIQFMPGADPRCGEFDTEKYIESLSQKRSDFFKDKKKNEFEELLISKIRNNADYISGNVWEVKDISSEEYAKELTDLLKNQIDAIPLEKREKVYELISPNMPGKSMKRNNSGILVEDKTIIEDIEMEDIEIVNIEKELKPKKKKA